MRPILALVWMVSATAAWGQAGAPAELVEGKRALAAKQFVSARKIFSAYARTHPDDVQGALGVADAELGLRRYEAAEVGYRAVVAKQPLLWAAHKNLVIVEAALGRWEEFDREREVLRAARERGAAGLSVRESDVIDVVMLRRGKATERWIVREYFLPVGRAQARYNFENFDADGRVRAYVSLESADALKAETMGGAVAVGAGAAKATGDNGFALDWYDGKSHGTVATYAKEPTYEVVRAEFLKWAKLRR